ncbi:MAG: hypothetical protein J6I45_04390 [Clostridia bacterium]|nr:hypothetical protein [Clostridia bacterium]
MNLRKALLPLLLTLLLLLSSCGIVIINDKDSETTVAETIPDPLRTEETTAAPPETEPSDTTADTTGTAETLPGVEYTPIPSYDYRADAKVMLDGLPEKDLEGFAVNIFATSADSYIPGDADNEINDARLERNLMFEERYNTKVMCTTYPLETLIEQTRMAILTDTYYCDLLSIPLYSLGSFAASDSLLNLRSLPYVDFDAPYFNQDAINAATAGNYIYAALGDANLNENFMYCVYFNRGKAERLGIKNLYKLAESGDWTWDKLAEYAKLSASVNGSLGFDSTLGRNGMIDALFTSTGTQMTVTQKDARPTLNTDTAKFGEITQKIKSFLTAENGYTADPGNALGNFYGGKALFFIERLTVAPWINDMRDNWGILPLPKYDSAQAEYSTYMDPAQPVFAVLANNADIAMTAHILMGYNAASYGFIADEYRNTLMYRTLRDNNSVNMLDYITANPYFDFANMFGNMHQQVSSATVQAIRDAVDGYTYQTYYNARKPYFDYRMQVVFELYSVS